MLLKMKFIGAGLLCMRRKQGQPKKTGEYVVFIEKT